MLTDDELFILAENGWQIDPKQKYSVSELDQIATAMLKEDVRAGNSIKNENPILFEEHIRNRNRREIYNKEGTPDPAFGQGFYNRTHPEGRKTNSPEQRQKNGASWYR